MENRIIGYADAGRIMNTQNVFMRDCTIGEPMLKEPRKQPNVFMREESRKPKCFHGKIGIVAYENSN